MYVGAIDTIKSVNIARTQPLVSSEPFIERALGYISLAPCCGKLPPASVIPPPATRHVSGIKAIRLVPQATACRLE